LECSDRTVELVKELSRSKRCKQTLAQVTGKRKREVGLVVMRKFTAFTTELIARILASGEI